MNKSAQAQDLSVLLESLLDNPRAGVLEARSCGGPLRLKAQLVYGVVTRIQTQDPVFRLGSFLSTSGMLEESRIQAVELTSSRAGVPAEDVLLAADLVEPFELEALRNHHAAEALLSLDLVDAVTFSMTDDVVLPGDCASELAIELSDLVELCEARRHTSHRLRSSYDTLDLSAVRIGVPATVLTENEEHILDILSEPLAISELCVVSGLGRWQALNALDALRALGAVQVERGSGWLGRDSTAHPIPPHSGVSPEELGEACIELARTLMEVGHPVEAVEAFRAATAAVPSHPHAARLLQGALEVCSAHLYRENFPAEQGYRASLDFAGSGARPLSPSEAFLLSRLEVSADVRSAVETTPMGELDALLTLARLKEDGYLKPA